MNQDPSRHPDDHQPAEPASAAGPLPIANRGTLEVRRLIARRKALDLAFSVLGMTLVIASLSVLVILFGSLVRDGGARLTSTHEVKLSGQAPGLRELVGTLRAAPAGPDGKPAYSLERDPLDLRLLADAARKAAAVRAATDALDPLVGKAVVVREGLPEPGVTELVAEPHRIRAANEGELKFARDQVAGTLRRRPDGSLMLELPPVSLDLSGLEADPAPLVGKRIAIDPGVRSRLPLKPRSADELVAKGFFRSAPSSQHFRAGILPALVGSVLVVLVTMLVALPLGVAAGIYLEEYGRKNWFTALVEINIANLAGVPSIIWGLMGLAVFVYALGIGRNVYSAGMTLGLLVLPIVILATREAIRAIPQAIREASYACGASRWQTVRYHILPYSLGGILTGAIIGLSRAIGETAPLITVGAVLFMTQVPSLSADSPFTVLPIQMFEWTSRPGEAFHRNAAAAGIVLLALTLSMNAIAIVLRYRLRKSIQW